MQGASLPCVDELVEIKGLVWAVSVLDRIG